MHINPSLPKSKIVVLITLIIVIAAACKKEDITNAGGTPAETGPVLSGISYEFDRHYFEYNSRNQLVKYFSTGTLMDSFTYKSNGDLLSFHHVYGMVSQTSTQVTITYEKDVIIRKETILSRPWEPRIVKYNLENNKIVKATVGYESGGVVLYGGDSTNYTYDGENIKHIQHPYGLINFVPIDTFHYDSQLDNPYLAIGKHMWTFMTGNVCFGESQKLPVIERYASWWSSGNSSGFGVYGFQTVLIDMDEKNKSFPKHIKKVDDGGAETRLQFTYIDRK
jgi:hypothetical protein